MPKFIFMDTTLTYRVGINCCLDYLADGQTL